MAEITNKKKDKSGAKELASLMPVTSAENAPLELEPVMELPEGFTHEELARLLKAKQAVAQGRYSDITEEHKKLLFVQWLLEHDKIGS